jgi:hypothetical protein
MMSIKHGCHFLAAIVLAAFSSLANSVECHQSSHNGYSGDFDGRFYQVVVVDEDEDVSWEQARDLAAVAEHEGVLGQLATINSFEEDEFVHCLIQETEGAEGREAWIGGSQAEDSSGPGDGWQWLNGELIDPINTTDPYTNWQATEPNDFNGSSEDHLGASHGGNFGWNDEANLGNIGSYVVEFGDALAPIPATSCAFGSGGCELGEDGPVITYPQQAIVSGEVEVRTWRFTDDPDRCGVDPLIIPELVPGDGDLVIAPYLCSTFGEIIVRRTESPVEVPTGIVQITGTNKYGTQNPVFPGDPTDEDVVVYRNNLDSEQLEKFGEMGVDALFQGNVAETTNGVVNPPRGAGGKGSYFIEGLRIHFDLEPGYNYLANTALIDTRMVELQRYKLGKGLKAVIAAKPALKPVSWLALRVLADAALFFHNRGDYGIALHKVKLLLKLNDQLKYKVIPDKNPYGEVTYRYLNARDIYERRLIPYN